MSEATQVPATEAAMRDAWRQVCMVEYRITGDMMKATAFADRIEKTYKDAVRAETLADVADVDEFLAQLHDTPYTRQTDWVTDNYTLIRKAR